MSSSLLMKQRKSNLEKATINIFSTWRREVVFAGFEVPIQMDVSIEKMIFDILGTDPKDEMN
ncbi:hypothetical protein KY285_036984 [Solanum tuberosum]|nr:hypothetical protein KY285_036984 [Solanum tuberosum]